MVKIPDDKRDELVARILELYVEEGSTIEEACQTVGIEKTSFYRWINDPLLHYNELYKKAKQDAYDREPEVGNRLAVRAIFRKLVSRQKTKKELRPNPNDPHYSDPEKYPKPDPKKYPPVLEKMVIEDLEPSTGDIALWLNNNHPRFIKNTLQINMAKNATDVDEIMDWSEPDQPGTRIIK